MMKVIISIAMAPLVVEGTIKLEAVFAVYKNSKTKKTTTIPVPLAEASTAPDGFVFDHHQYNIVLNADTPESAVRFSGRHKTLKGVFDKYAKKNKSDPAVVHCKAFCAHQMWTKKQDRVEARRFALNSIFP